MPLQTIGHELFARDSRGQLQWRIATVFPRQQMLVIVPGTHATQRAACIEAIDQERRAAGQESLSPAEQSRLWNSGVDLILEGQTALIRPDPENMALALEADELLQQVIPKRRIRFLGVQIEEVREAIKRRGECWRITPVPRSVRDIKLTIVASRMRLGGQEVYYYNNATGTRLLTCQEFAALERLADAELRQRLTEIRSYCMSVNDLGNPEVDFFIAGRSFRTKLLAFDYASLGSAPLRSAVEQLRRRFDELVPPELRQDNLDDPLWRETMFTALSPPREDAVAEEVRAGLSPEFHLQIQWMPGGRIENGELMIDAVFEEPLSGGGPLGPACDDKVRGLIFNYVRDYDDLEYINVGRIGESLSEHPQQQGRRDVYVVAMKQRGCGEEIVKIVRMQKWGIGEHLDQGKPLVQAILEAEEYTDYILDRRLGCRRLGMNLPSRLLVGRINELYFGRQVASHGTRIWSTYFERDYARGLATDKIPASRFRDPVYARRFAALLGQAAAPNLIVGRCEPAGAVTFDKGDEILVEDQNRMPVGLMITTHAGTFVDHHRELPSLIPWYAAPIKSRAGCITNVEECAEAYVAAFVESFSAIQQRYRQQCRAYDALFRHRPQQEGTFGYRWKRVLQRLHATDVDELARRMRESLT